MKTSSSIALIGFCFTVIVAAQEIPDSPSFEPNVVWRSLPDFRAETTDSSESQSVFDVSDVRLDNHLSNAESARGNIDFGFLKEPTGYLDSRRMAVLRATYQASTAGLSDAAEIAAVVLRVARNQPDLVCEFVQQEIQMHPDCACEIIKAAIEATEANHDLVLRIVESAITASPENMRIISQCAIAHAPSATHDVQKLLSRLDPNAGKSETSAKDAKVSMTLSQPELEHHDDGNPLDRLMLAINTPYPVVPPPVSLVDP